MAVRQSVSPNGAGNGRAWFVAACLLVLFVAALFLRAYWNLDAAEPEAGKYVLSGGSDPYYHKHAIDAIQANDFTTLTADPMLNFPLGSINPNPPLYQWSVAFAGKLLAPFFDGGISEATWVATLWSPAVYGALTLLPIYFLGAALFNRRAGLIAALLWTVSTSAIDAAGVGLADHDAAVMFFATLAFLFYVKTIQVFRGDGNWVTRWSDGGSVSKGLGDMWRARRVGFAYALLAGMGIAAVALTWKGFNYVIGILFVYAILQMVIDHWRNRDSTGLFLATFVAMLTGVVVAYPFYAGTGVANFLEPTWFLLAGFLVAGLVLVPTRDLPSILVMPSALGVAALAGVVAFFVFPSVAQSLLYATVYFKQTRLYETIAEAHPADFSTIAFGIGPIAFFLALAGWFTLLFRIHESQGRAWIRFGIAAAIIAAGAILGALVAWLAGFAASDANADTVDTIVRLVFVGIGVVIGFSVLLAGERPEARLAGFALVWAAVALFMANSAVRFLFNAIPVFCLFAAFMADWVLTWLDFGTVRKSIAANGSTWAGLRRGLRPLQIIAVILIALLFVVPTTLLAADAALPPEAERRISDETESDFVKGFMSKQMGAYGQGFIPEYWNDGLTWLDQHDANITDPTARPAFLSWWDYGHWAIAVGKHPAVADNFQNGYEFAAAFILSQNETQAVQLLAARLAEDEKADLQQALTDIGATDPAATAAKLRPYRDAEGDLTWDFVTELDLDQSAALLEKLEAQTGKSIRYFAVDVRMFPYDNPQTSSIEQSSIFYAPVKLKGEDPDNYVTTKVSVGGAGYITVKEFQELARNPVRQVQATSERLEYQQPFFNSMYWRAYIGTPVQPSPGEPVLGDQVLQALNQPRPAFGMEHFRLVYSSAELKIVEYYRGATVEGTVTEGGAPLAGVSVVAYDDAGLLLVQNVPEESRHLVSSEQFDVPHVETTTDAAGRYSIRVPFALEGGNVTLVAMRDGVEVGRTHLAVTREDANVKRAFTGVDMALERGSVTGIAFEDKDANGQRDEANETVLSGVDLMIGGVSVTTDAEGKFTASGVSAGLQNVTTNATGWTVAPQSSRVRVAPEQTTTHNVALQVAPAIVRGQALADLDGDNATAEDALEGVQITFEPDAGVAGNTAEAYPTQSGPGGNYSAVLRPGTYVVTATYTDSLSGDTYTTTETIVVNAGDNITGRNLVLAKSA